MKAGAELENSKDDVLRKIGRNIVLFQQIEQMLKHLIASSEVSGFASELEQNKETRSAAVGKQTMGTLVGSYFEKVYPENFEDTGILDDDAEIGEPYFSFKFALESSTDYIQNKKQIFVSMVDERNYLVHHLLSEFDPKSIKSCNAQIKKLDLQHEKLVLEFQYLKKIIGQMHDVFSKTAKYFQSSEFELSLLRQKRLVVLLGEIVTQVIEPGGWVPLDLAGRLLWQHASEDMDVLKERYGHNNLKGLILATGVFEISEGITVKGGIRVLYRFKPGWKLIIDEKGKGVFLENG